MIQAKSWEEVMDWSRRFAAIQSNGQSELRPFSTRTVAQKSSPPKTSRVSTRCAKSCNGKPGRPQRTNYNKRISRRRTMRVMVLLKANKDSEAGVMPSQKLLEDMGKYNEELVNAGVMLAGEGLHPSSKGKRVRFSGAKRTVIDGPFAETKELIAGYWLWQVKSIEDAVQWLKRAPFDGGTEVEIRPLFEAEDFGKELTPELRAQEDSLRARIDKKHK